MWLFLGIVGLLAIAARFMYAAGRILEQNGNFLSFCSCLLAAGAYLILAAFSCPPGNRPPMLLVDVVLMWFSFAAGKLMTFHAKQKQEVRHGSSLVTRVPGQLRTVC